MEISIDLKYLRQMAFNDENLLRELLQEWFNDVEMRIQDLSVVQNSKTDIFKQIHELKTNFSMIQCVEAIRHCESMIQSETLELTALKKILLNLRKITEIYLP
ncbi:MAG: hypothetical protein M3Q56_01180 [Bacteroidota bacterium]|nr:hypothetical protein [Bacteroidota bacterium]